MSSVGNTGCVSGGESSTSGHPSTFVARPREREAMPKAVCGKGSCGQNARSRCVHAWRTRTHEHSYVIGSVAWHQCLRTTNVHMLTRVRMCVLSTWAQGAGSSGDCAGHASCALALRNAAKSPSAEPACGKFRTCREGPTRTNRLPPTCTNRVGLPCSRRRQEFDTSRTTQRSRSKRAGGNVSCVDTCTRIPLRCRYGSEKRASRRRCETHQQRHAPTTMPGNVMNSTLALSTQARRKCVTHTHTHRCSTRCVGKRRSNRRAVIAMPSMGNRSVLAHFRQPLASRRR